MTSESKSPVLVLENEAGDYFVVPHAVVERGRVAEERKAELERLIAEPDDVTGHTYLLRELAVRIYVAQLDNMLIQMIVNAPAYPPDARTDAAR
jgi:predicted methyltransferase